MYKRAYPCRCNRAACLHRQTLRTRPDHYVRGAPKCRKCKRGTMRLDPYRLRREHQRTNCDCEGYAFRHRRGSKWCVHALAPITAEDVARRYGWSEPQEPPF